MGKQLIYPTDFHSMEKILLKSMETSNYLVLWCSAEERNASRWVNDDRNFIWTILLSSQSDNQNGIVGLNRIIQLHKLCSPSWELELRPLGVATGNASAWLVSEDTYLKTPPVGRRQPMTSLPACHNISAAGRLHHQLFRLHWLVCLKKRAFW